MSDNSLTVADVRAHIERRLQDLEPRPSELARLEQHNALGYVEETIRELGKILTMLDQVSTTTAIEQADKLKSASHPGNELTTTPREMLCSVGAETLMQSDNQRAAVREHRLALTNDARWRADELLQQLEKAAQGLWSLVRQEESYVQSEKTEAINVSKLVYRFLVLPFIVRRSVMGHLGFPDAKDHVSPEKELNRRFFVWVRENNLTDRLHAEIAKTGP